MVSRCDSENPMETTDIQSEPSWGVWINGNSFARLLFPSRTWSSRKWSCAERMRFGLGLHQELDIPQSRTPCNEEKQLSSVGQIGAPLNRSIQHCRGAWITREKAVSYGSGREEDREFTSIAAESWIRRTFSDTIERASPCMFTLS